VCVAVEIDVHGAANVGVPHFVDSLPETHRCVVDQQVYRLRDSSPHGFDLLRKCQVALVELYRDLGFRCCLHVSNHLRSQIVCNVE
jgi:hypothetical protein